MQIALQEVKGTNFAQDVNIYAGMLKNTKAIKGLITSDEAYKFMKKVWGTAAYW